MRKEEVALGRGGAKIILLGGEEVGGGVGGVKILFWGPKKIVW